MTEDVWVIAPSLHPLYREWMKTVVFSFCLLLIELPMPIQAQTTAIVPAVPTLFTLPINTPVRLKLNENLSSATNRINDRIDFEVLEDVKVRDQVVISRGAIAMGTVTEAKPKGMLGKAGKLDVAIDSVRLADGKSASLSASQSVKGKGHGAAVTTGVVVTALVLWPAAPFFLLMHGNDVNIARGTEITAYVSGDTDVSISTATQSMPPTPQPIQVPTSVTVSAPITPAANAASMMSPAIGSTFAGSVVTFEWVPAAAGTNYYLWLGTAGAGSHNLTIGGKTATNSTKVEGLPTNGETIYVRLWTELGRDTFQYADYTYKSATTSSRIVVVQ
jgi:hypothetical protein